MPSLLIIPAAFQSRPDPELTRTVLHELGMLDEALEVLPGKYRVGERFLDHVAFLGCSPAIEFDPADAGDESSFVHVSLQHLPGRSVFRQGFNPRPPLCPACRSPVAGYVEDMPSKPGALDRASCICPSCGCVTRWLDMSWRDGAVVVRDAIEIVGIHPREALPNDAFMDQLARSSEVTWRCLYL